MLLVVGEVLGDLYAAGLKITEVRIVESSLEDVFVDLTGRAIEDTPEPVGVARTTWLPPRSSMTASSWCG